MDILGSCPSHYLERGIMAKKREELTTRQLAFIDEYLICMNGTQAYMTAYPKASYDTARANSSKLLVNASIKAEIERRMEEHALPSYEALKRLTDIARGSFLPFMRLDNDGHVYFNFNDDEAKKHFHLIKKIKSKKHSHSSGKNDEQAEITEQWVEVELHDALRALELLGKYHKLFTDKVEQTEKKVIQVTFRKSDG
jgi:phage terminase small subunit